MSPARPPSMARATASSDIRTGPWQSRSGRFAIGVSLRSPSWMLRMPWRKASRTREHTRMDRGGNERSPRRRRKNAEIDQADALKTRVSPSVVQEAAQLPAAAGVLQLAQRLCLDLTDALTR